MNVRAVIAESYERIHRSNLIGMGVLPLQFAGGRNAENLGLTGHEIIDITGLDKTLKESDITIPTGTTPVFSRAGMYLEN